MLLAFFLVDGTSCWRLSQWKIWFLKIWDRKGNASSPISLYIEQVVLLRAWLGFTDRAHNVLDAAEPELLAFSVMRSHSCGAI